MVNKVEHALYTEANELIKAANNPPANSPLNPVGNKSRTKVGNA